MSGLRIIGAPFRSGCNREGAQLGPVILRELLDFGKDLWEFIPIYGEILPLADIECQGVKNYYSVVEACECLRNLVSKRLADGDNVVTVGGDHSLGLGSVAGALQNDANLGLIWFDAHGDVNNEQTSPSGHAHGMPVAALMGLCSSALNDVPTVHLKPQNVFWVGARDLDEGEIRILQSQDIFLNVYSAKEIHRRGMATVMEEIRAKMAAQSIRTLHLSFDIDGMDTSVITATGTRVPGGLTEQELQEFIEALRRPSESATDTRGNKAEQSDSFLQGIQAGQSARSFFPSIRSIDFVEYNPLLDNAAKTEGLWCARTLRSLIEAQW